MAEWCSNGPTLEEDIAMVNVSLDLFGQATNILAYAGKIEGKNRTEDDLAYRRNEREFYNSLISERPNGHFGDTIARNFLIATFSLHLLEALSESKDETIAAFAKKYIKEVQYHYRHSAEWVVRLGNGTEESKVKIQTSFDEIWSYTGDLFAMNEVDQILISEGIAVDLSTIKTKWEKNVSELLTRASLSRPEDGYMHNGRLEGLHSEDLGHLLCDMQYLQRAYPEAKW
jgi:ring-1,2-phenylacetyl-CoA epoxidase subunit PaaC